MIKVLILALCVNWIRAQNVDDAIRDLYMKIDSLEHLALSDTKEQCGDEGVQDKEEDE